jgi:tripartite-type tricarboxylate transporter receptor subunit TctC
MRDMKAVFAMLSMHAMLLQGGLICGALAPSFAQSPAPSYPTQPIRMLVPYGGGGPSDTVARVLAEPMARSLGQPVVVENKTGAAGRIAMNELLAKPKDGYTLHQCSYIDANNTVVLKNPGYRLDDIAPITLVSKSYYAFTVAQSVPANSLEEFIRYAKSRDGGLNYGRVGPGGITELLVKQFEHLAGFKSTGVTFRGTHEALQEMMGGRIDFVIGPINLSMPLHEAKKVKVLAMTSAERLAVARDVPTFLEQKIPIMSFGWWGMCAATGVPRPIVDELNRHIVAAVNQSTYQTVMDRNGMMAATSSADELRRIMTETADGTGKLMRDLNIPQID